MSAIRINVKIANDPQRRIMEILSLFRVMNNYYKKKKGIQEELKPKILQKFQEGLESLKESNWLFVVPTALEALTEDFTSKKDSFRFPDSILLFEAWMNLGFDALYPQYVLHFKYPGLHENEKYRHLFQFIFSTSRGFGFPVIFSPQFYEYTAPIQKYLDPFLKWVYTVCHKANQAIDLVGTRFNINRHHPGEFESVIVSEFKDGSYGVFNTLLHGYYATEPKKIGYFTSLKEALENSVFSYTIGDHAMSLEKLDLRQTLDIGLISNNEIEKNYDVDFYTYIKKLLRLSVRLWKKIENHKQKKYKILKEFSVFERIHFQSLKIINILKKKSYLQSNYPAKYFKIIEIDHYIGLMQDLKDLIFETPLYSHTIHDPKKSEKNFKFLASIQDQDYSLEKDSRNSIFLAYILFYEKKYNLSFKEAEILREMKELRDQMAKMWLYFRERHFNYASKKIKVLSTLSTDKLTYNQEVKDILDILIPIISVYEIFHRSLAESVYPESVPQIKRLGTFIARFFGNRYNPIGVSLMKLFNRMAWYNWSHFIMKNELNIRQFFTLIFKLPLWNEIPIKIKSKILNN